MKVGFILILFQVLSIDGNAQSKGDSVAIMAPNVLDGVYIKAHCGSETRVICSVRPYSNKNNLVKTVWSIIDTGQALFQPNLLYVDSVRNENGSCSQLTFWEIIREQVYNGNLQLYSPYNPVYPVLNDGDVFKYPINYQAPISNVRNDSVYYNELLPYFSRGKGSGNKSVHDPLVGDMNIDNAVFFTSKDIVQYRLKVDWYFDRIRSVLDLRIIGIAPVVSTFDLKGEEVGKRELFWLYFPACQSMLNAYALDVGATGGVQISILELFNNRQFDSYIFKESNSCATKVNEYTTAIDATLDFQFIQHKVAQIENELWGY